MTPSAVPSVSTRPRLRGLLIVGVVLAVGGAGAAVLSGSNPPASHEPASVVATSTPSPPLTSSVSTSPSSEAALSAYPQPAPPPIAALEPPPEALPPRPDALPALTPAHAADPEAVAARFLVTYATFGAGEDPAAHHARLADFTTPALADELGRNSSASAALEDLRARNVEFAGQVVEISVSERSESRTVVAAVVEHTTAVDGLVDPDFDLVPHTVTLVPSGSTWLVAGFGQ